MEQFIQKYQGDVMGVLNGFDRLVLRGTLRALTFAAGMMQFLSHVGVLLKDFGTYVQETSERLKEASLAEARRLARPIRYLPSSQTRKEDIARQMVEEDGIHEGLIGVLTCVEPCMSYEVRRDGASKKLVLERRWRKCLHLYHYWMDPVFGFMNARIQTWFPFPIQVCVNGREWLAREMDQAGMGYDRRDNCFVWMEDAEAAQRLMDRMTRLAWPRALAAIAEQLNPAQGEILQGYLTGYYWSVHQSEWASDLLFRSARRLEALYPPLVRGAISAFGSGDVMRFLGRKPHGCFQGEVVSDYKRRPEGVRVKHRVGQNSVKVYNKQGSVLRVETTINDPRGMKVYRAAEGKEEQGRDWRPLRKGIVDLRRRAEVSQKCNERYLDALASLETNQPIRDLVHPLCRPVHYEGRRMRALQPWAEADRALLAAVSDGAFAVNGFRNRDIAAFVFPKVVAAERHRSSARVTRLLRLLRAHHLIRKVPRTHRYMLTERGRRITSAVLKTQDVTLEQLNKIAA